jgi:hypothetical protein
MKKMILVVAVAGLSVLAVAQADKKKDLKQSEPVASPRDLSTGMASGRKGNYDLKEAKGAITEESQASTAREASTGKATGKMQNVSTDATTQTGTQQAEQHEVKAPRDVATGQASGKRQHQPVTMTTATDEKKPEQPKK